MANTPLWKTRAADITKAEYREAKPTNVINNVRTPSSGREITAEQAAKQKQICFYIDCEGWVFTNTQPFLL